MSKDAEGTKGCLGCFGILFMVFICSGIMNPNRPGLDHAPRQVIERAQAVSEKVQAFREEQASTVTTRGPIEMSSVQETNDGLMKYQTGDGRTWVVEMTKDADGDYHYSEPREVQ